MNTYEIELISALKAEIERLEKRLDSIMEENNKSTKSLTEND